MQLWPENQYEIPVFITEQVCSYLYHEFVAFTGNVFNLLALKHRF